MKDILISVIVPVFNGESYIKNLIKQFEQQFDRQFEVIFIDDGSTDNTYEALCLNLKDSPFCFRIVRQDNQGVSAARNSGLSMAAGKYVTFVDVDDEISSDYAATLIEFVHSYSFDVLYFDQFRKNSDSPVPDSKISEMLGLPTERSVALNRFLSNPTALGIYNFLISHEFLDSNGIHFAVGYPYYEDYDFILNVFFQADKIVKCNRILYYYVMNPGSAMMKFSAERIRCLNLIRSHEKQFQCNRPDGLMEDYISVFVSRLYWSVLWQAASALREYKEFKKFAELTKAGDFLQKLKKFPSRKVRYSCVLYRLSSRLFYYFTGAAGRKHSRVEPVRWKDISSEVESVCRECK